MEDKIEKFMKELDKRYIKYREINYFDVIEFLEELLEEIRNEQE